MDRSSSITSVPVMSEGMRSGVNWILENPSFMVLAMVDIRRVFASPGTPTRRAWPPQKRHRRS